MIRNERIKLLACALNTLGLEFGIGGFVAPAIGGQLHGGQQAAVTVAWAIVGSGLHGLSQLTLGRLKE